MTFTIEALRWKNRTIRCVQIRPNEWKFVLKDLTDAIGERRDNATLRISPSELTRASIPWNYGESSQAKDTMLVTERGMYELLFTSKSVEAYEMITYILEAINDMKRLCRYPIYSMITRAENQRENAEEPDIPELVRDDETGDWIPIDPRY